MVRKKKLLISEKEARKLLGAHARGLSKEDITVLIQDSEHLARFAIQQYLVLKSEMVK